MDEHKGRTEDEEEEVLGKLNT